MILYRSLSEDPGQILSTRSLPEDFAGAMSSTCLYESSSGMSWEVLAPRSCKVLSSSRSFYDDLVGFS